MTDKSSEPASKKARHWMKPPLIPSYKGPSKEEVLKGRREHISAGQYTFYKEPLMLVEGAMQYIFDEQGRRYLDAYSNVCHIGHCHPHVVQSVQAAMATVLTNTRYLHPTIVAYAEKLKSKLPKELDTCFFVNSGSEANDLAVRLARVYTGKKGVVVLQHAYHGTTATCTGMSTCLAPGTGIGCIDWDYNSRDIHVAERPDLLRGPYKYGDAEAGPKYAKIIDETVESKCPDNVACFLAESVQGVGGQVFYPDGFLADTYKYIRARGGVCIADEVQVGFGRCVNYWGFESQGVVPDIVTFGKPIGNGFPLAAVVCKRKIADAFNDCQYFNTAGGNPVACAAGLAVLEAIEADNLQKNAAKQGKLLLELLNEIKAKRNTIGDVRGLGLFVGIELVKDCTTLEPDSEACVWVFERCRELGVLMGKGGPHNNVIRLKPPICLTKDDVEFLATVFDRAIEEWERKTTNGDASKPTHNLSTTAVAEYMKQLGMEDLAKEFQNRIKKEKSSKVEGEANGSSATESQNDKKKKKKKKSKDQE